MQALITLAVGVILPVRNEEKRLGTALSALGAAMGHSSLVAKALRLVVVLDSCHDSSASIARRWSGLLHRGGAGARCAIVRTRSANVGAARRLGAEFLLHRWGHLDPDQVWLATTDADSQVPAEWLARQVSYHEAGIGMWTGTVAVDDWSERSPALAGAWARRYRAEGVPLHGASLGLSAGAYQCVGGFSNLPSGEDRALYQAVIQQGIKAIHDPSVPVVTSSRRIGRAPDGFAHALDVIERSGN